MQYLMLLFQLLIAGLKLVKFFMKQSKVVGKTKITDVSIVAVGEAKTTNAKVTLVEPVKSVDTVNRMHNIELLMDDPDFHKILNPDTTTPPDYLRKYTDDK